jgi:hypothetical protein
LQLCKFKPEFETSTLGFMTHAAAINHAMTPFQAGHWLSKVQALCQNDSKVLHFRDEFLQVFSTSNRFVLHAQCIIKCDERLTFMKCNAAVLEAARSATT